MAIYNKPALDMLVDLINEGNPDLPFPINKVDYDFTTPVALSEPLDNGHNTEIRIIAKPSSPYTGNVLLTYRRLSLPALFREVEVRVRKWVPNTGTNDYDHISTADLLPLIAKKYGIRLDLDQIVNYTNIDKRRGHLSGWRETLQARDDSLVFIGSINYYWDLGERELGDLITVDDVDGRHWPDKDEFGADVERKPYLTPICYHTDFTMYDQENSAWGWWSGSYLNNSDDAERIYNEILNTLFLEHFGFGVNPTLDYKDAKDSQGRVGTQALRHYNYSLPDSSVPEANAEFYNRVIVIRIPDDCPWGTGDIFFHYNV